MKILFFMALFSAQLLVTGFTSKQYNEIILTQPFTKITLTGVMKVILVQGGTNNILQYKNGKITAEVHIGELIVTQKNNLFKNEEPFVLIPVNELNHLKIKDDAVVFTQGIFKTDELTIDERGDGMIKLSIDANKISVRSRGKGKIQIEGNYQQAAIQKDEYGNMLMEYVANKKITKK